MKYDFLVFGGTGQQGRICVRDLFESGYSVLIAVRDDSKIKNFLKNKKVEFTKVDLRDQHKIIKVIKKSGVNIVINCAELIFNIPIMEACIKTKVSCTDLGGLQKITKEQFKLHNSFKKSGIICITGCGSTPGITNIMAKYGVDKMDSVDRIELGFVWDSNIKKFVVPYSIESIFEEFTEDPITFHNGKFVKENRIRCQGTFDFMGIGKQTVYCIVHSEVYSFSKYFKNKGLKNVYYMAGFPKHSMNVIKTLMELKFDSKNQINIHGKELSPLDFTKEMLKKMKMPKGYKEIENLWIRIYGRKNKKEIRIELNCIIKTIKGWEEAGSNVDTGRTISIISQMLKKGLIKEKGVHAPEAVVPIKEFFNELKKRQMYVYKNNKRIN